MVVGWVVRSAVESAEMWGAVMAALLVVGSADCLAASLVDYWVG